MRSSNNSNCSHGDYTDRVATESSRVRGALTEAFLSEGREFDLVRYIGLVNGCQQFLADVTASLCDLDKSEFNDLQCAAIKVFADAFGLETQVIDETQQGENP